jgi:hypothetical protein
MKLITIEVSDCSLAVTTVDRVDGGWDCSIVLSQRSGAAGEITHKRKQSFVGLYDPEDVLEMAVDFTSSYIENCFPELVEAA